MNNSIKHSFFLALKKYAEEEHDDPRVKLLAKTDDGIKVYLVNSDKIGDYDKRWVKSENYVIGNHHWGEVDDGIPKDEVWISNRASSKERKRVIFHELHERKLMHDLLGIDIDQAHKLTKDTEHYMELVGGEFPDLEHKNETKH